MSEGLPGRAEPAPLDSIVSLAVAIAESPGAYAFLLGSGISRDAGVPTGGEVLSLAIGDIYRLEHPDDPDASAERVATWADETGHTALSYSEVLERLVPDQAARQSYLAKYFADKEPSETHRLLAQLAADGFVRVFVTTNFDRLLEDALREVGITPVVITADDELLRATEREHARCYVLKVHGDYLQQTIRNTASELATLDPKIAAELQEVVDRFGLVVIGYSGSDAAVGTCLRARKSRRGSYWVSRGDPGAAAVALIEAMDARVVRRDTASAFLTDVSRRIEAFRAHPSGETPPVVLAEVIGLLRKGDRVGLREKLTEEWRALDRRVQEIIEPYSGNREVPREVSRAVDAEIVPVAERARAALLPLIDHDEELFAEQLSQMRRELDRVNEQQNGWPELLQWVVWQLAQSCGAYAVARERFACVGALLRTNVEDSKIGDTLATLIPSHIGQVVAAASHEPPLRSDRGAEWVHLASRLDSSEFLQETFPELVGRNGGSQRWLDDFNFLACYDKNRVAPTDVLAYWTMRGDGAMELARRLGRDPAFADELARGCFDISGGEFLETVKPTMNAGLNAMRRTIYPPGGGFVNSDAVYNLPDPPSLREGAS